MNEIFRINFLGNIFPWYSWCLFYEWTFGEDILLEHKHTSTICYCLWIHLKNNVTSLLCILGYPFVLSDNRQLIYLSTAIIKFLVSLLVEEQRYLKWNCRIYLIPYEEQKTRAGSSSRYIHPEHVLMNSVYPQPRCKYITTRYFASKCHL
jgi:hypothetical protein